MLAAESAVFTAATVGDWPGRPPSGTLTLRGTRGHHSRAAPCLAPKNDRSTWALLLIPSAPFRHPVIQPRANAFAGAITLLNASLLVLATDTGAIPKRLRNLRAELARLVLPSRRPRIYPRAVKIKMSSYPRKRPSSRGKIVN